MISPDKREAVGRFPALSTGVKILLALTLALLPLGVVAIVASIETSNTARANSDGEARVVAEVTGRRLGNAIERATSTVRAATEATTTATDASHCRELLNSLAGIQQFTLQLAIYRADRTLACQSDGYPAPLAAPARQGSGLHVDLDPPSGTMRFVHVTPDGRMALADIPASALRAITQPLRPVSNYRLVLSQGGEQFVVRDWLASPPERLETIESTFAGGAIASRFAFETTAVRPVEALSVVLPVLMLLVAAILGWFLVRQILLRPLARLERAVSGYGAGDELFVAPTMDTAALELRTLCHAFEEMVTTVRGHERTLEAGISEQMRLTREVHHRVKNNLQVVSSLLSLHARGAKTAETANAYASIQRRVEALAIVQRNLFSEAAPADGLSIRPVIAELASGLQQSAPETARLMISLNISDLRVSQDTAVPIAFLITELVELAMLTAGEAGIAISLEAPDPASSRAELTLSSPALIGGREGSDNQRYKRVLDGLARQLRAPLNHDAATGDYAISIPVLNRS